jgi:hypothetical protein
MSGFLPIHSCVQISYENEILHKKIKNLKVINENLIVQLNAYSHQEQNTNIYSKKRFDTSTQTDYDSKLFNTNQNYEVSLLKNSSF